MPTYSNNKGTSKPSCPFYETNNVELHHILETIKTKWKICIVILTIFTLFAVVLAVKLPKQYSVESILLPPAESSVSAMTILAYNSLLSNRYLFGMTSEKLYFQFLDNLQSSGLLFQFFIDNKLIEKFRGEYEHGVSDEIIFEKEFHEKLDISFSEGLGSETKIITVELYGNNPVLLADLLNSYVNFVNHQTLDSVKEAIVSRIAAEKTSVNEKIFSLRMTGAEERNNKLNKIAEDLKIAEQLNIVLPADVSFNYYSQSISSQTGIVENKNDTPGYLKGVNILKAEFDSLKDRKNNDPFIPGLSKLLEEREYLDKISKVTLAGVDAVRIDTVATPPDKAVKPNKILVVAVGGAFGVLISIFVILLDIILKKRLRKQYPNDAKKD